MQSGSFWKRPKNNVILCSKWITTLQTAYFSVHLSLSAIFHQQTIPRRAQMQNVARKRRGYLSRSEAVNLCGDHKTFTNLSKKESTRRQFRERSFRKALPQSLKRKKIFHQLIVKIIRPGLRFSICLADIKAWTTASSFNQLKKTSTDSLPALGIQFFLL